MKTIVVITEKDKTVALPLAQAMGWTKTARGYEGTLNGNNVIVQWARGHLIRLQDPEEIHPGLGWNNPSALAPLPRAVKRVPIIEESPRGESSQDRLAKVGSVLKIADEVILATDADREGEAIGWNILEHFNYNKPVRRLWLAEGTDEISVKKAFANLLAASEKKSMARAAEARASCDWAYMYLVRLLTYYGRHGLLGQYLGRGMGRESVVSSGRVQSAALYMVYRRELAIENFKPKTFYNFDGHFTLSGHTVQAEYVPKVSNQVIESAPPGVEWEPQGLPGENKPDKPYFVSKPNALAFKQRLLGAAGAAKVGEYAEGKRQKHPPITYDLVAAKADLGKMCKINGDAAQAVIEDLYEQGFISYPRTAHGELPMNLYDAGERNPRLKCMQDVPGLADAAKRAMDIHNGSDANYKPFKPKVFVSKKLEHHGLIPSNKTVNARVLASIRAQKKVNNKLMHRDEHMEKAYKLIATRYVQSLLPPAEYATQKIFFTVPVEDLLGAPQSLFLAKEERTVDPGYLGIMSIGRDKAGQLPKLKKGDAATVSDVDLKEGKTQPPSRYNEVNFERALQTAAREVDDPELRKFMADGVNKPEGIGTPATRKDIIPTLKARNYIRVDNKQNFFLDDKGREYIEFQMNNGHHWLYRVETTAEWEGRLAILTEQEDDAVAIKMRDEFIEESFSQIEAYIEWMNAKFANVEKKALPRVPSVVTDRMKTAIKSMADAKGIKVPSGALSDPKKAAAFFDEHKTQGDGGANSGAPSAPQLGLLEKVEQAAGVKATAEQKADRKQASDFIEKYKGELDKQSNAAPASDKMIKFADSLAAKMDQADRPDPSTYATMAGCRAFLDAQTKNGGKPSAGKKPVRRSAR